MVLSKKMEAALNEQLKAEMYSHYLYLSMAAYFESANFKGFAGWMKVQAKEEYGHSMKFFDHINDRNGRVQLKPIDAPPHEWASPLALFEEVLKHEQHVTSLIHNLADLAIAEKDHATAVFLHWFINEQVEEESTAQEVVDKLKLAGDSKGTLLMLDHQLGKRE